MSPLNVTQFGLCAGFIALAYFLIRKTKKSINKKRAFRIVVPSIIVFVALCMTLAVNVFATFQSAEDVFRFTRAGRIDEVIEGERSCMVQYYRPDGVRSNMFVKKTEGGFKTLAPLGGVRNSHRLDGDVSFTVYCVLGTDDYYVFCMVYGIILEGEGDIKLCNGEKIITGITRTDALENTYSFSFYVNGLTEDYYLLVDGKKVYVLD